MNWEKLLNEIKSGIRLRTAVKSPRVVFRRSPLKMKSPTRAAYYAMSERIELVKQLERRRQGVTDSEDESDIWDD